MSEVYGNDLECPHCGASFHYELTRCPNCGVNIYFQEGEPEEVNKTFIKFIGAFRLPLGILAGWLASIVISLALYIPIRFAFTMPQSEYVVYSVVTACIMAGSFSGGFFAFRVARKRVILGAVLVGFFSVGITIVILLREWESVLPFAGVVLGWIVILAASFGGAKTAEAMLRKVTLESFFVVPPTEENLYQSLFIKAGYDHNAAKRLIEYERQRTPEATRSELISNAIRHWERDNRTRGPVN